MKVRFLADANFNNRIVTGLKRREPLVDFQRASDVDLAAKADLEVLRIAATAGRILVTHDWKTMPAAFEEFTATQPSSGVLLEPQRLSVGIAIEELLLVWAASDAEDWENVLCPIPF